MTPQGRILLFSGVDGGHATVGAGSCAGTQLDLGGVRRAAVGTADVTGRKKFKLTLPIDSCGVGLQALDVASCDPTDQVTAPDCTATDDSDNRTDDTLPYRDPHSRCPSSSEMIAFGAARYRSQYSSSRGRTRLRSTGNGGSHDVMSAASLMPG